MTYHVSCLDNKTFFMKILGDCATLMITNCTSRSTMKQERLDSLFLVMIEAELLRKINFDDVGLLKNFARRKSRKKSFKM